MSALLLNPQLIQLRILYPLTLDMFFPAFKKKKKEYHELGRKRSDGFRNHLSELWGVIELRDQHSHRLQILWMEQSSQGCGCRVVSVTWGKGHRSLFT